MHEGGSIEDIKRDGNHSDGGEYGGVQSFHPKQCPVYEAILNVSFSDWCYYY